MQIDHKDQHIKHGGIREGVIPFEDFILEHFIDTDHVYDNQWKNHLSHIHTFVLVNQNVLDEIMWTALLHLFDSEINGCQAKSIEQEDASDNTPSDLKLPGLHGIFLVPEINYQLVFATAEQEWDGFSTH